MKMRRLRWFSVSGVGVLMAGLMAAPLLAQSSNFGKLTLVSGFQPEQAVMNGNTGGSYSLSTISNRDRHNNLCVGFGSPTPDHILELKSNFNQLTISSSQKNTTLLIQGPNQDTIRCGDRAITDTDWKTGLYKVWVGSIDPGTRTDYTLSIQAN